MFHDQKMLDTDNYQIFLIFATEPKTLTKSQPPKPIQNSFATETENRNRFKIFLPKPKPIQNIFATETENWNRLIRISW